MKSLFLSVPITLHNCRIENNFSGRDSCSSYSLRPKHTHRHRIRKCGGSTTEKPVMHSYEPHSPHTSRFSWGPLTLASAPRCEVSEILKYCASLIAGRKDCLHYLTSVASPLRLQLSKRQEHSTLPQSWLFNSSCVLSSTCCNFSHNPIKFNGLVWMRNHETDQSPINLTVLLAKLNNVTALYKIWVSE